MQALSFPARYKYSDEFPNGAAYAGTNFVEDFSRRPTDASTFRFEDTLSKALVETPFNLFGITRKNGGKIEVKLLNFHLDLGKTTSYFSSNCKQVNFLIECGRLTFLSCTNPLGKSGTASSHLVAQFQKRLIPCLGRRPNNRRSGR